MTAAPVKHGLVEKPILAADIFECQSGILDRLRELGAEIEVRALPAGDYELGAWLVERKTVLANWLMLCARALLDRFGSVADALAAGEENWLSTPGIGPKRAAALAQTLTHRRHRS